MFFSTNLRYILFDLAELYFIILIVRAILSWFPYNPHSPLNPVRSFIYAITEPVLAPLRRIIPPIGMIDISFLVAIIVMQLIVRVLASHPL